MENMSGPLINRRFFAVGLLFFLPQMISAQGIVNNGAHIVLTTAANVYIDGAAGNYKNQNGGLIKSSSTGGTVVLKGNWTNNASNEAFSNDGATVKLEGAAQTIDGSSSSTFYHLNLGGTGTKTLGVNTTVGGISTLTGVLSLGTRPLDLNSRTLSVSNPATTAITSSTGYIISETNAPVNPSVVKWNMGTTTGAHIYPFGVSGTLIPFTFNKTTAGSSDISVSTRATSGDNLPWAGASSVAAVNTMASAVLSLSNASNVSVIDRWWDIHVSAPATANLVFSYRGSENTTTLAPLGTFAAQHWNGTSWDQQTGSGAGVTSGVGTVSVTGASSFSPWILSTLLTSGPLPVALTHFSAVCQQSKVTRIEWSTASELNSEKFIVEKSRDLISWSQMDEHEAAGNSTHLINYSLVDTDPYDGISYYRLIQQDLNGMYKIYGPVSVSCGDLEFTMSVFPNPSNGNFTVEISSAESISNAELVVTDVAGKLVSSLHLYVVEGKNQILLEEMGLQTGAYFVRLISEGNQFKPVKILVH